MRASIAALAIAAAAMLGTGCGSRQPATSSASSEPVVEAPPAASGEPADSCTTADDCVLVDACCGCNSGGKKIAIRKDAVAAYDASRGERCGAVLCAQMISTDPSCDAEAICGSGNRCRVAPHMQHQ